MTSPEKRRPLPALVFIVALTLLTALVWFRVLHRHTGTTHVAAKTTCSSSPPPASPTVLPTPARVSLVVLNSTQRSGIAAAARKTLLAYGFKSTQPAGNDSTGLIPGVAEIRYGPSAAPGARLLAYYLPQAKMVPTQSAATTVTVSLGTKYTKVMTKAAVQTQLTLHHITLSASAVTTPSSSASPTC